MKPETTTATTIDRIILISVDTDFDDVLKLDRDKKRLTWDENDFPMYSPEQVKELSVYNQASYHNSFFLNKSASRPADSVQTPKLHISGRLANASDKLHVDYPEGYRDKRHTYWERADRFDDSLRRGYVPVNTNNEEDAALRGFYSSPDGTVRVGSKGADEMILMKEPREQNDERIRQVGEQSNLNRGAAEEDGESDIRSVGGIPYNPKQDRRKDAKLNWHVTEPTGERRE